MNYDPIKQTLGKILNVFPVLRIPFYGFLHILLLRAWFVKRLVMEKFGSRRNEKLKFFDAGMGFGQYSHWLVCKFPQSSLKGVDVKEEQVDDCNRFFRKTGKTNASFYCEDLVKLSETDTYDLILNIDVLEHIEEDEKVMQNFYRALKPGGALLISTPSNFGGSEAHDEDDESFVGEHVRNGYSKEDITAKLMRAGFEKVRVKYSYGTYGHFSWVVSMKIPMQILNISKLFAPVVGIYFLIVAIPCLILNFIDVRIDNPKGAGLVVWAEK